MGCTLDRQLEGEEQNQKIMDATRIPNNVRSVEKVSQKQHCSEIEMPNIESFISVQKAVASSLSDSAGNKKKEQNELLQNYRKCLHYYINHDVDSAYKFTPKIKQQIKIIREKKQKRHSNPEDLENSLLEIQRLINQVENERKDIQEYNKQITNAGWVPKSNRNGVQVFTRRENGTVGVKVVSIIDVPFQVLVSVLIQIDLHKKFIPFLEVSRQEKIVNRNCRIGYAVSGVPLLTKRQAFFQGLAYDRLKQDGTIFMYTRSIHDRQDLQEELEYYPKINEKFIQLAYKYFVVEYKPLTEVSGRIIIAINVDSKINIVPMWVLDRLSQDYGQNFLKNIVKISKNYKGSVWQQNVQKNPQLFNFLHDRLRQYVQYQTLGKEKVQKQPINKGQ